MSAKKIQGLLHFCNQMAKRKEVSIHLRVIFGRIYDRMNQCTCPNDIQPFNHFCRELTVCKKTPSGLLYLWDSREDPPHSKPFCRPIPKSIAVLTTCCSLYSYFLSCSSMFQKSRDNQSGCPVFPCFLCLSTG